MPNTRMHMLVVGHLVIIINVRICIPSKLLFAVIVSNCINIIASYYGIKKGARDFDHCGHFKKIV